nr:hypothetical protein [Deltaproteobacteria bacterium]
MSSHILPLELKKSLLKIKLRSRIRNLLVRALPVWVLLFAFLTLFRVFSYAQWMEPALIEKINFSLYLLILFTGLFYFIPVISSRQAASLLDQSADSDTVIPAAVSYVNHLNTDNPFIELTIEQAREHLSQTDCSKAVPFQGVSRFSLFAFPLFFVFYLLIPSIIPPPDYNFQFYPAIIQLDNELNIDPNISQEDPELAVIKEDLNSLKRKAKLFGDKKTQEMVRKLENLIKNVEKGAVQPFEAAKMAEAIRKKLAGTDKDEFLKEKSEAFSELAKSLKRYREFKDLAKELMKKNERGIKKELLELQKKMAKMNEKALKRLLKKLDKSVKKASTNLKKKAERMLKKAKRLEKKGLKKEAEKLRKKAKQLKNAAKTVKKFNESDKKKMKYLQKRMQQAKNRGDKKMQRSLKKEMNRLQRKMKKQQKAGNKNKKGQKAGNKNKKGQKGKKSMSNMQKSLERYMRSRREQRTGEQAKMTAKEIREAMKRLKKRGSMRGRSKGIKDFFRRAKGKKGGRRSSRSSGSKGSRKGSRKGSSSQNGKSSPYRHNRRLNKGSKGGRKKGQGASAGKGSKGKGWGTADGGKLFGKKTRLKKKVKDHNLRAKKKGAGPSRNEIILGASEKGFSKRK